MTRFIPYIVLSVALLPWLHLQLSAITPGDAAFLIHGARQLLNGHSMVDYYYDTNLPMSFLVYTPIMLLEQVLHIPAYMVSNIYTLIVIIIALISMRLSLRLDKDLSPNTKFLALSSAALAMTIPIITEFGQKDHLIAIALIPFIIAQRSITQNPNNQKIGTLVTLCLFTPFILIKPHYGLIPTAIILHRFITQKRLNTAFDYDVVSLAIGTITYITYTYTFHFDFIDEILPMAYGLYASQPISNDTILNACIFFAFTTIIYGIIKFTSTKTDKEEKEKELALFFSIAAALSIIPFGLQNKGFSLHLIPTIVLLVTSLGIYLNVIIQKRIPTIASTIVFSLLLYGYIYGTYLSRGYPVTHKNYQKSDIAKIIEKHTDDYDSLFIEDNTTCALFTSALYTNNIIASRFPSMWGINGALSINNENEKIETLDYFGKLIADDFNRFKPKAIFFMLNRDQKSPLQVIYDKHEPFQDALSNYKYEETIEIDDIYPCYRGEEKEDKTLLLKIYTREE